MPSLKDAVEAAEPVTKLEASGFDDGLAWEVHEYRGIRYKVTELAIGDYDDIVKKATRKEKRVDPGSGVEEEVEILDQQLQSRMMLKSCIVEPARIDITKLGTRLVVTLNRVVNNLHYGDEPDAVKPAKKDDGDEEKKPGNR